MSIKIEKNRFIYITSKNPIMHTITIVILCAAAPLFIIAAIIMLGISCWCYLKLILLLIAAVNMIYEKLKAESDKVNELSVTKVFALNP